MSRTLPAFACLWALCGCGGDPAASAAAPTAPETPAVSATETETAGPADLPTDSVYQLDPALTDDEGHDFHLASLRGRPVLLTFFYASCTSMCPLIVSEIRALDGTFEDAERRGYDVLLVSIDERDTPSTLHALAVERDLPRDRYHLVRGAPEEVRTLAATVGMTYRPTDDGGFAHSALFTVLDEEGRISLQHDGLGTGQARLHERLAALIDGPD